MINPPKNATIAIAEHLASSGFRLDLARASALPALMVQLTDEERSVAAGAKGDGAAMAMRILADAARLMGAPRLIPVESAHIDGALYHGDSGTLFAEKLAQGGAKVAVPSTLNVGALDLMGCSRNRFDPVTRDMAKRLMIAHEEMGCRPTWTCAPYQAGHRPKQGTDVAWGESNAVAFCNSVLGARTNRYGDFLDISCAISGRAPDYGLHRAENRVATFVFDVTHLKPSLRNSDIAFPVLGSLFGRLAGTAIGVVDGLQNCCTDDRLKAFGAAAASSGGVGLFHIAGCTPEAPSVEAALSGGAPHQVIVATPEMVGDALARLSTATGDQLDAVAIGSPHLSQTEIADLDRLLGHRKAIKPIYACTGRHALEGIEANGARTRLEKQNVIFVLDTCVVVAPILPEKGQALMTNSGKFAHYAPGNTGYATHYGSLADCVESAVAGRVIRVDPAWR